MLLPATSLYAALLILMLVALSVRIIRLRRKHGVLFLDNNIDALKTAIRAQANFAEYTPFALLGLGLLEIQHFPAWALHLLASLFLAGRLLHAYGHNTFEPGKVKEHLKLRVAGMVCTFNALGLMAICLLFKAF